MKITAVSYNNVTPSKHVNISGYAALGVKRDLPADTFIKANGISFGSNVTISEKLNTFLPELYDYILHSRKLSLEDVGKIVQKHSHGLLVKPMNELSADEVSPYSRHAAHFQFSYPIKNMKEITVGSKTIFLDVPLQDTTRERLIFMDSVSHEMTHVFQEEASDRISRRQFIQNLLDKDFSSKLKFDTLCSMSPIFNEAETKMQQPLLRALNKKDIIPCPVKTLSHKLLNEIYLQDVNLPVEDFLTRTLLDTMDKYSLKFPDFDKKTLLEYIPLSAQYEREAYLNSGYLVKRALGIKMPVDTEYRVLLYDKFAEVVSFL